jgi:hypothetical protein
VIAQGNEMFNHIMAESLVALTLLQPISPKELAAAVEKVLGENPSAGGSIHSDI